MLLSPKKNVLGNSSHGGCKSDTECLSFCYWLLVMLGIGNLHLGQCNMGWSVASYSHMTLVVSGIRCTSWNAIITFKCIVPIAAILFFSHDLIVEIRSVESLSSVTKWQSCMVVWGDPGLGREKCPKNGFIVWLQRSPLIDCRGTWPAIRRGARYNCQYWFAGFSLLLQEF